MKRTLFLMCALVMSGNAMAGELVRGATIIELASTYADDESFAIRTKGGTGTCGKFEETWIVFPEATSQSGAAHYRAFEIAREAFRSGSKIRVHSFDTILCTSADFISVSQ